MTCRKAVQFILNSESRGENQTDVLDGIRGFAVTFVIFSHLANANLVLTSKKIADRGAGQIGVYLFFALSAYLLTRALLRKLDSKDLYLEDWLDYFSRRIMRIYPFFVIALLFTILSSYMGWNLFVEMNFSDFWRHILIQDGKMHFWTIATEVKYYLILPFLIVVYSLFIRNNYYLFILGLLLAITISSVIYSYFGNGDRRSIFCYLPIFLCGTIVAILHHTTAYTWLKNKPKIAALLMLVSLTCIILLMPKVIGNLTEFLTGIRFAKIPDNYYVIWGLITGCFILSSLAAPRFWLRRVFENDILRCLGNLSFSLYINHWFVLEWVKQINTIVLVKLILFWVVTITSSVITYALIERPLSKFRLNLLLRRST